MCRPILKVYVCSGGASIIFLRGGGQDPQKVISFDDFTGQCQFFLDFTQSWGQTVGGNSPPLPTPGAVTVGLYLQFIHINANPFYKRMAWCVFSSTFYPLQTATSTSQTWSHWSIEWWDGSTSTVSDLVRQRVGRCRPSTISEPWQPTWIILRI